MASAKTAHTTKNGTTSVTVADCYTGHTKIQIDPYVFSASVLLYGRGEAIFQGICNSLRFSPKRLLLDLKFRDHREVIRRLLGSVRASSKRTLER